MAIMVGVVGRVGAAFGLGVLLWLALGPELAAAQQVPPAPDGQRFETQSARTQQVFTDTFGPNCAAREWVWQHRVAVDDAFLAGPVARDGQALGVQDVDIRLAFVAVWGPRAIEEWLAEHNAAVAHQVLNAAVGLIPCPAARPVPNAIDTRDVDEAVTAAKHASLLDAHAALNKFRDVWTTTKADVRKKSTVVADAIQAAYDQAAAVVSGPSAPLPTQTQYLQVLQNLLTVVQNADSLLGGSPPAAAPSAR